MGESKETTPLRILFVEDHQDTAEVFARLLESQGYTVHVATDWRTATALARRRRFDLLLCDIGLPDGDGCELLPKLRQELGLRDLRGIAFSAHGTNDDIERAKSVGFDAYVLKPADMQEILRVIEEVCRRDDTQPISPRPFSHRGPMIGGGRSFLTPESPTSIESMTESLPHIL